MMCGAILISIPTIEFGGFFLLGLLSGRGPKTPLTGFQKAMFRAGHAHAGVIVILSVVVQLLADHAALGDALMWLARVGPPVSSLLISGGFFAAAGGKDAQKPNKMIVLIYLGAALLAVSLVVLGVGLLRG